MNLPGIEIRGGLPADVKCVGGSAVWQRGGGDGFAASGNVRIRDVVVVSRDGGQHRFCVDFSSPLVEAHAI